MPTQQRSVFSQAGGNCPDGQKHLPIARAHGEQLAGKFRAACSRPAQERVAEDLSGLPPWHADHTCRCPQPRPALVHQVLTTRPDRGLHPTSAARSVTRQCRVTPVAIDMPAWLALLSSLSFMALNSMAAFGTLTIDLLGAAVVDDCIVGRVCPDPVNVASEANFLAMAAAMARRTRRVICPSIVAFEGGLIRPSLLNLPLHLMAVQSKFRYEPLVSQNDQQMRTKTG